MRSPPWLGGGDQVISLSVSPPWLGGGDQVIPLSVSPPWLGGGDQVDFTICKRVCVEEVTASRASIFGWVQRSPSCDGTLGVDWNLIHPPLPQVGLHEFECSCA